MSDERQPSATWVDKMITEYEAGADDIEVCAALRLSRSDFEKYYDTDSRFRELVDIGRLASAAFWRRIARQNIFNKSFNTTVWSFTMKNRFGWAEKSETINNEVPLQQKSVEELQLEIAKKLKTVKRVSDLVLPLEEKKNAAD